MLITCAKFIQKLICSILYGYTSVESFDKAHRYLAWSVSREVNIRTQYPKALIKMAFAMILAILPIAIGCQLGVKEDHLFVASIRNNRTSRFASDGIGDVLEKKELSKQNNDVNRFIVGPHSADLLIAKNGSNPQLLSQGIRLLYSFPLKLT